MGMLRRKLLTASIVTFSIAATPCAIAGADIPVVPSRVMDNAEPPSASSQSGRGGAGGSSSHSSSSTKRVVAEPGVNQILPVAIDHLNRIVTPFGNPEVTTSSSASTEIRDNVVYVGTDNDSPVTMFITQRGSEAEALSLTLVPKRIPPRELFVELPNSSGMQHGLAGNENAKKWETSQPYVDTIRGVMREIALQNKPPGYTLGDVDGRGNLPRCSQSDLSFDFSNGQVMSGQNLEAYIGLATNNSSHPVEFKESSCGDWNVAAVAAWPDNVLKPGDKTEIYVLRRKGERRKTNGGRSERPSLLEGNR